MKQPAGWAEEYAAAFEVESVADHYDLRPSYPDATFDLLVDLLDRTVPKVLDAGCGPGDLARPLARRLVRVDAVDRSAAMVARGRAMDGGLDPLLRWTVGRVETAPLDPPYGLIVCGDSIHWFDWSVTLPAFARTLTPAGHLALVERRWLNDADLRRRLAPIYARHSINRSFRPLDVTDELVARGLFEPLGDRTTVAEPWRPTLSELVGLHHSQSGFVREWMDDAEAFDQDVAAEVRRTLEQGPDGRFDLTVQARVVWGRCTA